MAMYRELGWSSIQVYEALLVSGCEKKELIMYHQIFCLRYVDLFVICTVSEKSSVINRNSLNVLIPSCVAG